MNIDKYIKWDEIWEEEIFLDSNDEKYHEIIEQFLNDKNVELIYNECYINEHNELLFFFGESGGENESDTQGWSRDYTFIFDKDFLLIDAEYSQG